MKHSSRVQRPKGDLERELREQVDLLIHACESFDQGREAIGKHIALSLRVLLHHQGRSSNALLEQLGLRTGYFVDTAGALNPKNLMTECGLIFMQADNDGGRYLPLVAGGEGLHAPKRVTFAEWWNEPILKMKGGSVLNRRELVTNVADTDGGAHVDPTLDEAYMMLSRENGLGWNFVSEQKTEPMKGRVELVCIRQIAHELLLTLRRKQPKLFAP